MNLYIISQNVNNGYDTYSSAVVCANSKKEAISIHPMSGFNWNGKHELYGSWCNKQDVEVQLIGRAVNQKKGIILSSFHAG